MPAKESTLASACVKRVHDRGGYAVKNHGDSRVRKGRPDVEGVFHGMFLGLEVKLPGREAKVTPLQAATLEEIRSAGGIAYVVTSTAHVDHALELCRLAAKVPGRYRVDAASGCHEWLGTKRGKQQRAMLYRSAARGNHHLVSAARVVAAVRHGLNIDDDSWLACHSCDNPRCVNVEHIFVGTTQDNHDDMTRKGRRSRKVAPEDVERFFKKHPDATAIDAAKALQVHPRTIKRYGRGAG